jgi:hypothetical protein
MTSTRAIRRVCRSAFAHVVVLMGAGLMTTPAEEVEQAELPPLAPGRSKKISSAVSAAAGST